VRLEQITISTDKLPENRDRLRIVQISDVHVGLMVGPERLQTIVDLVIAQQPDILVSTGDLLDSSVTHLDGVSEVLRGVQPPLGKFAVTGNHEYYPGLAQSLAFLKRAGFTVVRNEVLSVNGVITIAGIDDPTVGIPVDEAALLSSRHSPRFTLYLKHRPNVPEETIGLFDLQLSGHTHRGQITPFNYIVSIPYPYISGFFDLGKGSFLYTSRGTGTWGPPIRVLAPPEVTIIDIVNTDTG